MTSAEPTKLPHLDDADVKRILCVVAHPDDMEHGAAAAAARWTSMGVDVIYVLATSGEAGIDGMTPAVAGPLREQEQRDGALVVGVEVVEFLDHTDGIVEYGLPLRRDIASAIRRHHPDLVVSLTFNERLAGGGANEADHRAVGLATLAACKDAGNRWIFHELAAAGVLPWGGVRRVAFAGSPQPTHGVDVTGFVDLAVASLRAHKVYLAGLSGDVLPPEEFLPMTAAQDGLALAVDAAVLFEVFDL